MSPKPYKEISRLFSEGTEMERAMAKGVRTAVKLHKLLGKPYVIARNGKMVIIKPRPAKPA